MRRLRSLLDPSRNSSYRIVILIASPLVLAWLAGTSQQYGDAFRFVFPGIWVSIALAILSFALGFVLGLIAALGAVSNNYVLRSVATFYVRIVRGIPKLVVLLYVGLVIIPSLSQSLGIGSVGKFTRAVIAFGLSIGAYHAEIVRGGIRAIGEGQFEAARSIGMTFFQTMRFVILPQALRITLPSIANEFILVLKDTTLASVLGVIELTRRGELNITRTRDTFSTWNVVVLMYLVLTVALAMGMDEWRKKFGD
jgi:His/Glu/Gln/Arg/opine family amino acid ABC transporter permease subunit